MANAAVAVGAFAWMLDTQLARLDGLTAPGWDLGQEQQLLWSLANGHGWWSSYEHDKNFLGIHVEPILLLLAGVERLLPSPTVPLIFAAAALAATAPAALLMFRALFGDQPHGPWLALALAMPIPFWAASQEAASDQFHPEMLALAPAMLMVWAGLRQRKLLMWILAAVVLACKEDQTFTVLVAALAVRQLAGPQMRIQADAVLAVSLGWLVLSGVILHLLWNGAETPALVYYQWMWQGGHNYFLDAVSRPDPWLALAGLMASVAGLCLLAPRWFLLALVPFAGNLLSDHGPMERIQLHYILLLMFPVLVAAGVGGSLLLRKRLLPTSVPASLVLLLALPALIVGFVAGKLPPGLNSETWLYAQPPASAQLLRATSVIPSTAAVDAEDGAVVWMSNRMEVGVLYDHPALDRYVVVDRDAWAHRGETNYPAEAAARLQASGRHVIADDGRFQVWSPA